jgi:hypothetical protein
VTTAARLPRKINLTTAQIRAAKSIFDSLAPDHNGSLDLRGRYPDGFPPSF